MKITPAKLVSLTIIFSILLGCSNQNKQEKALRVGVVSGPEKELAETAKQVARERFNLDVELITFNDYVVPNEALNQGDIDVNVFQHLPYLQEQSKQRGYKLAAVGNTFVFPIVAYSKKIKTITELQPEATIAIPNDPTNGGRALLLLQREGIISLKEGVGLLPKTTDIVNNPRKVNIIELEAPQLPRVLDDDKVTFAIINNSFAAQAGLSPEKEGLFSEDKESPYVNLIVTKEDNKNDARIKQFIESYQSPEVEATAKKVFKNGAIKGW